MRLNVFIFILFITVSSCVKEELAVPAHQSGNVTEAVVDIDPTYKYQVYFSLKDNKEVGRCLKTSWDIAFQASASGYAVFLNSARAMYAYKLAQADFAKVGYSDTIGMAAAKWCDAPNGNPDSTVIGDWRGNKPVYIIDMGYNENGISLGLAKLQLLTVTDTTYTFKMARLTDADVATTTISKDTAYNAVFYSLTTKSSVAVEPPKATWDIYFSQYTHIYNDMQPKATYLVSGCLLNANKTLVAVDSTIQFSTIDYTKANSYTYTNNRDGIGFSWKIFNGTQYTVSGKVNYMIKTVDGKVYKLHFTGFYNAQGVKGYPKFEYVQL